MKNRDRQRINRRYKEEMLNPVNEYGFNDPTAYEAIKSIISKELALKKKRSLRHKNS